MLNKWRRLFHSSRVKWTLVKMSASWCLVSMYRIWIFESRLILSNNQSKATLWVLDTCLIGWVRPLIIILITASLSSKTYNIVLEPECVPLDGTWSMLVRSGLVFVVGIGFRMFDWRVADKFPRGSFTCLVLLVWFGEEWNTSITKSQRSRAGIPSMRKPASREITSTSVELCETEVCFLHIQLIGTTFDFRKFTDFLLMLISSLPGLLQNQSLETILISSVVLCCPHNKYCLHSHVLWMSSIKRAKRLSHAFVHFVTARARLFTDHKVSSLPILAKYRHFTTICEQTVDKSPTGPFSSSLNWWSSMHGVATLYNCSVVLFASSQHLSTHFIAWPSMS